MINGIFHQIIINHKIGKTNKGISIFNQFHKNFIENDLNGFQYYFNIEQSLKEVEKIF